MNNQGIVFKCFWNDSSIHDKAILFWTELGALTPEVNPLDRAKQLVHVAFYADRIIAVTTANRVLIKGLDNKPFFNFRILIHPQYRIPGLIDKMTVLTRDFLQKVHDSDQTDCVGMMSMVQNEKLKAYRNKALWPSTGFDYVGSSKAGHHIRVLYFEDSGNKPS